MSKATPKSEAKAEPVNLAAVLGSLAPLANIARRIVDVEQIVEAGASVQQAIGEAERAIVGKQAELAEYAPKIEAAKAELAKAHDAGLQRAAEAKAEADAIVDKAKKDAGSIRRRAEEAMASAVADREQATAEVVALRQECKDAQAELAALNANLANAKAAARKLLE